MFKIIIADDEIAERRLLENIIRKNFGSSVMVYTVSNGKEALDQTKLWHADIALLDIEMPVMDGITAASGILKYSSATKVIFVTAYSLFSYAQMAVKLKASDFILKPVQEVEVVNAVRHAMEQVESTRQLEGMTNADIQNETKNGLNKAEQLMQKVKEYLANNYRNYDLSLASVSEILGLNPTYLSTLFKKCTGVNFVDYINDLRFTQAKELLKDPLRPTSEIASEVGFESASYFTRAFKKKTGLTPSEYRKTLGSGEEGSL